MSEENKRIIEQDSISDKIKFNPEKSEFMVKRKVSTYRYDVLTQHKLGRNPIKVKTEWLPLGVLDPKPSKEVTLDVILKRVATDTNTLLQLKAYFRMQIKASVYDIDRYKNFYLTTYNSELIINNIARKYAMPIGLSHGHEAVKIEFSKPERIEYEEAKRLNLSEKIPVLQQQGSGRNTEYFVVLNEFGKT